MELLTVLFPRVRAETLRLLFADAEVELHLRDLARQSGLSLGTVQGELKQLHAADLVTSHRDGNRRYFRANFHHPLFRDLQQLVLKTAGLRDVLARALRSIPGINLVFVFGSLAQSKGKASSDVDLMVIGSAGLRALAPALRKASTEIGREINPHTYTTAAWRKKRRTGNGFLNSVVESEKLFIKGNSDELAKLG
jgi:predicted nucleotidyltransferase